jgi:HTH-type transcriptional repressor of NAD biosynthesis genes
VRRGLVFGKFMPLHRGHQLLIDTALSEVDELSIVVYDSEPLGDYPPMPLELRLRWLNELYPHAESIVGVEDPLKHDPEHDHPRYAAMYADGVRFLGPFDKVFTSEPGYEEFSRQLGAEHVVVDAARALVPTSGTTIRGDLYAHRGWLEPSVYASLIRKVVFVGTESTGKTTLARRMAEELDTLWVHEFGRELWEEQGLQGSFADHLLIARNQRQREEAASRHARRFLFCDTNAWTTLHWSLRSYGVADGRLHELAAATMDDYLWVLCDNDFGWVEDGTRELPGEASVAFQQQQIADLERRRVPYTVASGPLEERVATVRALLGVAP